MKVRRITIVSGGIAVFIAALLITLSEGLDGGSFSFVGMNECNRCHANDGIGNQFGKWAVTPHARAYRALKSEAAKQIAAKHGIADPATDQKCLRCHTTGGGKNPATIDEGVGCEACHGPGSGYHELNNHASFTNRDAAYKRAISLGMYPIIGIDHIKYREKLCLRCHNLERPCAPDDPKQRQEQTLSLEAIANFVFKHPVRR